MAGSYVIVLKKKDPNYKFCKKDFEKWVLNKKNLKKINEEHGMKEEELIDVLKNYSFIEHNDVRDSFCSNGDVGPYYAIVGIIKDYLIENNLAEEDGDTEIYSCDKLLILR